MAITGQVGSKVLGSDAFQEIDITGITLPITKHNYLVTRAEDIAPAIREALQIAKSGRPGPVLVDITKDAQQAMAPFNFEAAAPAPYTPHPMIPTTRADSASLRQAIELIKAAEEACHPCRPRHQRTPAQRPRCSPSPNASRSPSPARSSGLAEFQRIIRSRSA